MSSTVCATEHALLEELVPLERRALDGWLKGDPEPNLAITAEDATYIDAGSGPIEGLSAVKAFFDAYRGKPLFDSYEMLNPKVKGNGDVAVLLYRLLIHKGEQRIPYDCTEVYQRRSEGWRVIHSHYSKAKQG